MSDDTRMALGIPKVVNTEIGAVEVRTLSAIEFLILTDQVVSLLAAARKDAEADGDFIGALRRLVSRHPEQIVGLLSTSAKRTAAELGNLPLDEYLEITIAFMDKHEKSIKSFFELKGRWEDLAAKTRRSRNSSTPSSGPAGPSQTSKDSVLTN